MLLNFSCLLPFFNTIWIFNALLALVLMIDPLNYASIDPSVEVFDGALATLGLIKPIKNYMLLNFSCLLPFFFEKKFLMAYNAWVLMTDPRNYAPADPSMDAFDGALVTLGWIKPTKKYMLLNFSCFLLFF